MSEPYWSALGGGVIDYEGTYNPATQYAPGDVVRYGGVDYLAVNPSLGVDPGVATLPVDSGKELDFAERTTDATVTVTSDAVATDVLVGNAVTYDGTPVMIEFFIPSIYGSAAIQVIFNLYDGTTDLGRVALWNVGTGLASVTPMSRFRYTPTPGVHTFKIRSWVSSGTGTMKASTGGPGQYRPAQMRITKA